MRARYTDLPLTLKAILLALACSLGIWLGVPPLSAQDRPDSGLSDLAVLVRITESGLEPAVVRVISGMTVTWRNDTQTQSSLQVAESYQTCLPIALRGFGLADAATSATEDSSFDNQAAFPPLGPGESFSQVFEKAGDYLASTGGAAGRVYVRDGIPQEQIPAEEYDALVAFHYLTGGPSWAESWRLPTSEPCSLSGVTCEAGHVVGLSLYENGLSGGIPPQITSLTHLEWLSLHSNQLSGPIPAAIGTMAALEWLSLSGNALDGELPKELGNLGAIGRLDVHQNELSGPIPPELGRLSRLSHLDLSQNQLTGSIPVDLFGATALTYLSLYDNLLTGMIPPEIGSLSQLRTLIVANNHLEGPIPIEVGDLSSLETLFLSANEFSGSIPAELGQLTNLRGLSITGCRLSEPIPPELGALVGLVKLQLFDNQLSGDIPATLANLVNLADLNLAANMLRATDPVLVAFLDVRNPGWRDQTVPPTDLHVSSITTDSVALSWTPVAFSGGAGYYEILYSETSGGPYTPHGHTASKMESIYTVDGLTANQPYYFAVRTYSPAADFRRNSLLSEMSEEVAATPGT